MFSGLKKIRRQKTAANDHLPRYGLSDIGALIKEVFGEIDPDKVSAFFPVKNEMAFLPAVLAHYRGLGYEQFLFFDDQSDDGTFEYLRAQDDCIVLHAHMTFGDLLYFTGKSHTGNAPVRFGTFAKMAIPHRFLPGKLVSYFDADEFLILPPGVRSIHEVHDRINTLGSTGVYASMVEFFPRATDSFSAPMPDSFDGLINEYGWFEAEALFDPSGPLTAKGKPVFTAPSKSMRLLKDYDIHLPYQRNTLREKVYLSSKEKRDQSFSRSGRHKTPILLRSEDSYLMSSHDAIVPPSGEILLTLAHFVFTSNFAAKINNARKWKTHAKGGAKYNYYQALLDAMEGVEDGFLSEISVKYASPQQLIDCGLMKW